MSDKIQEIRARQKDGAPGQMPIAALCQCDADREFLLAEVERLRAEKDLDASSLALLRQDIEWLARHIGRK